MERELYECLKIQDPRWEVVARCASTNATLREARKAAHRPSILIAQEQTSGRGQQGNAWHSLRGDLTFSIKIYPHRLPSNRPFLISQLLALAIHDALGQIAPAVRVKWPNDILIAREKVCGILIESSLRGANIHSSIMGVGVNIAPRPAGFPPYPTPATTLAAHATPPIPSPPELAARILACWNGRVERLMESGAEAIASAYRHALFNGEGLHRFADAGGEFRAKIIGAKPTGELLLLKEGEGKPTPYPFKTLTQRVGAPEKKGGNTHRE